MSVRKADWLYLGVSTFAAWVLIQQERGKDANLELLRSALKVVMWIQRRLSIMESTLRLEIDKELDNYGA